MCNVNSTSLGIEGNSESSKGNPASPPFLTIAVQLLFLEGV